MPKAGAESQLGGGQNQVNSKIRTHPQILLSRPLYTGQLFNKPILCARQYAKFWQEENGQNDQETPKTFWWGRQLTKSGKQECEGLVDVPGRNKERGELSRMVRGTGSRGAGI